MMVLRSKFDWRDAGWGCICITVALLAMQLKYKPFLESKEEAGHWSSPNVMSVISFVCQLVVLAVGLVLGYEEQGRLERYFEAQFEYDELLAQGQQNVEHPPVVEMEKQDEGDALLLSLVVVVALLIPMVLTGIILVTGGAPPNAAGDASTVKNPDPVNAYENPIAESKDEDGGKAASEPKSFTAVTT